MSNSKRIDMEKELAALVVSIMLDKGYGIQVHDGEDYVDTEISTDRNTILARWMFNTDEDHLIIFKKLTSGGITEWMQLGWVKLVYGNDGWDVVADHSVCLEEDLIPVNFRAEALQAGAPTQAQLLYINSLALILAYVKQQRMVGRMSAQEEAHYISDPFTLDNRELLGFGRDAHINHSLQAISLY